MKKIYGLIVVLALCAGPAFAQEDHMADGLASAATIAGEVNAIEDSLVVRDSIAAQDSMTVKKPLWKQKLYYGYNFDIYFHNDSRNGKTENGWSIAVTPEIGWRLKERIHLGLRVGGSYQDSYASYSYIMDGEKHSEDLRVMHGSWEVTPYVRYRLKTLFNGKVGIWLEGHLYIGMDFPRVTDGVATNTDYDGLRHSVTYGAQLSPVITYKFSQKSTFQIFFSILSLGYSGTTFCYAKPDGTHYNEYTNDIIIFSGKLRNMIANQFTPGLYGLRFGVQKSF